MSDRQIGLSEIQERLDRISQEMIDLIRRYGLTATSPLGVVEDAKNRISDNGDYVRFLELSLEGRILGELGDALIKKDG